MGGLKALELHTIRLQCRNWAATFFLHIGLKCHPSPAKTFKVLHNLNCNSTIKKKFLPSTLVFWPSFGNFICATTEDDRRRWQHKPVRCFAPKNQLERCSWTWYQWTQHKSNSAIRLMKQKFDHLNFRFEIWKICKRFQYKALALEDKPGTAITISVYTTTLCRKKASYLSIWEL